MTARLAVSSRPVRRGLTWLHRYVGLTLVLFLTAAGLSGATLGFYEELDALTFPALPAGAGPALDPIILAERVEAVNPALQIMYLPLAVEHARAVKLSVASRNIDAPLAYDEIFVDPSTGAVLGARAWGGPVRGMRDIMPFLFRFHYSLGLGATGSMVMGWVALVWTLDCFVGFWLTLPPTGGPGSLRRWGKAWRVRWPTTPFKISFDLHRAAGLWLWPLLFVLAWSSVAMNLPAVFVPVMQTVLPTTPEGAFPPAVDRRVLGWGEARVIGRNAMAAAAAAQGFAINEEIALRFIDWDGQVSYIVRSSLDAVEPGEGETAIAIDPLTGRVIGFRSPEAGRAGDVAIRWLGYLHEARVGGRAYDALLAAAGVAMAVLSITGVVIWSKKRRARLLRR